MTIGRRPDSDVFLDDVTVSRDHALLVRRGDEFHIDDLGSLNGTYVNRQRIDSRHLADGDELQVGKFKLTFLARMTRGASRDLAALGRAAAQVDDDRGGLQGARAGVHRHLDLEDPLPRGSEAARAAPHARAAIASTAIRRGTAAHDPAPSARRVPATAGDPPGAGSRPQRGGDRGARPAGAPGGRAGVRAGARAALHARGRARGDTAPTRRSWPSWRTSASSRARCAPARSTTTRPSARSSAR